MIFNGLVLFGKRREEAVASIYSGPLGEVNHSTMGDIYHHIHPGAEVNFRLSSKSNRNCIDVFFKGFHIGSMPESHTPVVAELIQRGFFLKGEIKRVFKQKYLPVEQIEFAITDQFTQA